MKLNKEQIEQIVEQVWQKYDTDQNGTLDQAECYRLFSDISKVTNDPSFYQNSQQILKMIDMDGNGNLSKQELVQILLKMM